MGFAIEHEGQRALLAVCIVFSILPTLSFVLRMVSRYMSRQALGATDWTMLIGVIFALGVVAGNLVGLLAGGMGEHIDMVNPAHLLVFSQALLAVQLLWAVSLGFTKSSIILFYIQIFPQKTFRYISYVVMALCIAFAIMVFSATMAICQPFEKNLNPMVPGTCGNRNAFWLSVGVLNIFTDLTVMLLPVPMIWRLNISLSKKVYLTIIFCLGFFVIAVSAIRLSYLLNVDFNGDLTYSVIDTNIWSLLEPTLAATVGNLPTLGPIIRLIKAAFRRVTGQPSTGYASNSYKINTFLEAERERDRSHFERLPREDSSTALGSKTTVRPGSLSQSNNTRGMFDGSELEDGLDGVHITTEIEMHSTPRV